MTALRITAALFVDLGRRTKTSADGGTWVQPPRARYECLLCRTTEGPVKGPIAVQEFVARIRTDHPANCTANHQGAHAA
ncbi:hypothetical protein J7I98_23805 [Streptomyces sp. ISL-98]|uniref:hypothetical protein n=1 Tax=Streptomyces sp. ISL-98 TaxID=2819192 RepID=UPI001BEAC893|nr:hypothetical protein [Streptomyces sp. ISL-98]MBT2508856.1 hypothetical protein [Streptomyces sp. ISL-98]